MVQGNTLNVDASGARSYFELIKVRLWRKNRLVEIAGYFEELVENVRKERLSLWKQREIDDSNFEVSSELGKTVITLFLKVCCPVPIFLKSTTCHNYAITGGESQGCQVSGEGKG